MLSKLAFLLQKSSDDYWVIWLKATCLSWRPGEYLSWRTGEHLYVLYLSLVKLFPTLLFFSHFCIMIIERGFADLSIESSFNIQLSVSPSIQLWEALWSQISNPRDQELENITRDFHQGWWWWGWKRNTAQKMVIPLALCQPCHMKLFFFVFLPRLSLNSWSQVHFKTSFFSISVTFSLQNYFKYLTDFDQLNLIAFDSAPSIWWSNLTKTT